MENKAELAQQMSKIIKEQLTKIKTTEELIDFVFSFEFKNYSILPIQIKGEIHRLIEILKNENPKTMLEIGTSNGGTFFLLCQAAAADDAKIISIDLPNGKFGGELYPKWKEPLYESFAKKDQKIYLLRSDSHDSKTYDRFKNLLKKAKLDFLLIDGDHTYEGIKQDFEMYSKLVSKNGIIAFHDIKPGPEAEVGGVPRFWKEVSKKHTSLAIIDEDGRSNSYGLGLVFFSSDEISLKYVNALKTLVKFQNTVLTYKERNDLKKKIQQLETAVTYYKYEQKDLVSQKRKLIEEAQEEAKNFYNSVIKQKTSEIKSFQEEVAKHQAELAEIKSESSAELEKKESMVEDLQEEVAKHQAELAEIKSSSAWQIMPVLIYKLNKYFPISSWRRNLFDSMITRRLIQEVSTQKKIDFVITDTKQSQIVDKQDKETGYDLWIKLNEPTQEQLQNQQIESKKFAKQPLISIITPLYETPEIFLNQLIESILKQTYHNWELCFADGNSKNKNIKKILETYSKKDKRIMVKFLPQNLHISGNSNECLKIATGDYIALLDHDDLLTPNALFEVAKCINENPEVDFIYSDKDIVSNDGTRRYRPLFKPDWSTEILLSANYLTHLNIIRKSIIDKIGGFRSKTDGAQDWDIFLRVTEISNKIIHIPKVLYHWREASTSVSSGIQAKPYVTKAQKLTLEEHQKRIGIDATVSFDEYAYPHYNWNTKESKFSIMIPIVNGDSYKKAINSILQKTDYHNYEIILVRNRQSSKTTLNELEKSKVLDVNCELNHYVMCINALSSIKESHVIFFKDDLLLESPHWLKEINGLFSNEEISMVSGKILNEENKVVHAGLIISPQGKSIHLHYGVEDRYWSQFGSVSWYRNCLAVTDSLCAIKNNILNSFEFRNCESIEEVGTKIHKNGKHIVYSPNIVFKTKSEETLKEIPNFNSKTFDFVRKKGDPFFNMNFSYQTPIPTLIIRKEHKVSIENKKFTEKENELIGTLQKSTKFMLGKYQQEALYLSQKLDFTSKDLELNKKIQINSNKISISQIAWFLPNFTNPFYGGIHTILNFAAFLKEKGIENYFIIVDKSDKEQIKRLIISAFPSLSDSKIIVLNSFNDVNKIPQVDVAICSLWTTAYYLLKFNKTKRKFYFLQDYEALFYPAGTIMGQVEATYRFDFYGIANTRTVKEIYQNNYKGVVESFDPAIDSSVFYPSSSDSTNNVIRIYTYGRPDHPRNGFELTVNILKKIKEKYGKRVRIVSAGAEWEPNQLGLQGIIENVGVLGYKETGDLFRKSDIGLIIMFTKHPSYIPLELMACKCLVISNFNPGTTWFLKDGENCLLSYQSVSSFYEKICEAIENKHLRLSLTENALNYVKQYSDWTPQFEKIFTFMQEPKTT